MAFRSLIRKLFGPIPAVILSLLLIGALLLLTSATQHSEVSGESHLLLLIIAALGICILLALVVANMWSLRSQWKRQVLGSRLTVKMIGMFVLLVVFPLSAVYYVSTQFLSKGIDSWFDVRVDKAVDDALLLGRTALETIKQEAVDEVSEAATRLVDVRDTFSIVSLLDEIREEGGYLELSVLSENGRIIASSQLDPGVLVPDTPDESVLSEVRGGGRYVNLEPLAGGGQQLRIVIPILTTAISEPSKILQAIKLIPLRYARLAESIETASAHYKQTVFSRGPLKFSLILTLTVVALAAMMLALWVAIVVSRRMVAPLRELAEGTQAVASGDYNKKLEATSTDEFGVLVESFNDMTHEIHRAQSSVRKHQRETERQRTYLEAVLGHLSSGVLSFNSQNKLLTHNAAADQILGLQLQPLKNCNIDQIRDAHPQYEALFSVIKEYIVTGEDEWHAEIPIFTDRGRQVLITRGTKLALGKTRGGGYVVVFDDITELIQAQRDAAWGEVARRLAHEIKNPLTPIQLSAERIRRKYLSKVNPDDRDALDRATRTIAQQVESMKGLVNAFSNYAQPAEQKFEKLDLNQLIRDVAELYSSDDKATLFKFDLDPDLPSITADGARLRQVLNNLIINSKDATTEIAQPEVCIQTRYRFENEQRFVELKLMDNGQGFPMELHDRLFEPYITTKSEKGTGLGLAIVKRIIEEQGGIVWLENLPDTEGAVVTITLPIGKESEDNITDLRLRRVHKKVAGENLG